MTTLTTDEVLKMVVEASSTGCADELTGDSIERFAKMVASEATARYEQKIQDLEDMITELQERQE